MTARRLKHFGWGREGEGLTAEEEAFVMARAHSITIGGTDGRMYPGSFDTDNEKNTIGTTANQNRSRSLRSKTRRRPGISMKVHGNVNISRSGR